ncbi:hypothetical protein UFOVP718_17 [uncultured Caudovirales phage]|uniref:Gp6 domain containing protein n=1 Tax=uncultured Caudovirales phage TaxID=2100421 RepID=A0A6J5NPS9_9CAUD|nr:hypothetical protein UFOVP718_17 [uncultured Caudovirales phage]
MAAYSVTQKYLVDNYAVVVLLTNADPLEVGQSFTLAGVDATFNGSYTVVALPQFRFIGVDEYGFFLYDPEQPIQHQVLFAKTAANVIISPATGTLTTTPTCTWITADSQVEDWLGIGTATAADQTFITQCRLAANEFCFRRRQEAGYKDSLTTVPNASVTLGTVAYAGFLYRQRGAVTDFAGFDGLAAGGSMGLSPMIKQLLGIDRPAVF